MYNSKASLALQRPVLLEGSYSNGMSFMSAVKIPWQGEAGGNYSRSVRMIRVMSSFSMFSEAFGKFGKCAFSFSKILLVSFLTFNPLNRFSQAVKWPSPISKLLFSQAFEDF